MESIIRGGTPRRSRRPRQVLTILLAISSLALMFATTTVGPAEAAAGTDDRSDFWYEGALYVNLQRGTCLAVSGNSSAEMRPLAQAECTGHKAQQWAVRYVPNTPGHVQLVNANSGKCMTTSTTNSRLYQASCSSSPLQVWERRYLPAFRSYALVSASSGRCVDIAQGGRDDGQIRHRPCNFRGTQVWNLRYHR